MASVVLVLASVAMVLAPTMLVANVSWVKKYSSLASLVEDSDLVIVGNVISSTSYKVEDLDGYLIFTDYAINVKQVVLGATKGKTIIITQTGGTLSGETRVIRDDPLLEKNCDMVLFLKSYEGKYFILGGPQGRFHILDGKVYSVGELVKEAATTTDGLQVGGKTLSSFIDNLK